MKKLSLLLSILFSIGITHAQLFVKNTNSAGCFEIATKNKVASIYYDTADFKLVSIAAHLLQQDLKAVTDLQPALNNSLTTGTDFAIIAGTVTQSAMIQQLVKEGKLNISNLNGQWEGYHIQVIDHPTKNINKALVIAGSDKRGTAYGIFELSKQIGVSPWYWWADVPVKKSKQLFVPSDIYIEDAPKVKYRGIFLNDEAPALTGWANEKFGGKNHQFYTKVFELILRSKANYLWPAMWDNAFNDDDTLNPILANEYGIVMGNSHHEPMMRAQQEWKRYGHGAWNYNTNKDSLNAFWRQGIKNMGNHESLITVGMRGDGDEPMTEGTAISLLENIVENQRKIIADVTGKPASEQPQLWALYKEVQAYYDEGMRVPDDVTLLLCDDNWGNIRKLPKLDEQLRSGGYGIYYHFDYVGDPRNYKWLNTNNIARTWEQMHLAYEYNVRRVWIVNVGDLKPMEFPISFFLDYAWNPEAINQNNISDYYTNWATAQFGDKYAKKIGQLIKKYSVYNARIKPELLDQHTYSLENFGEADRIVKEYDQLLKEAKTLQSKLTAEYKDAYYQLVLHPIEACANLNATYVAQAKNSYYSSHNDIRANAFAKEVKFRYDMDASISRYYNQILAGGKWNHMMDQTHIGYTYWQQPEHQVMPAVQMVDSATGRKDAKDYTFKAKPATIKPIKGIKYYEQNGVVAMHANHFSDTTPANGISWNVIPDIGRDGSGLGNFPVTKTYDSLDLHAPQVSYQFATSSKGNATISVFCSPTLGFYNKGLRFAISVDGETPEIVNLHEGWDFKKWMQPQWSKAVADNIIIRSINYNFKTSGKHTVTIYMIDPAIIYQHLEINFGTPLPTYLGVPETTLPASKAK